MATNEQSFPLFPRFPGEIRIMIWESCLSPRVLMARDQGCMHVQSEGNMEVEWSRAQKEAMRPVLLLINREARDVAFMHGRYNNQAWSRTPSWQWLQPCYDTFYLNSRPPISDVSKEFYSLLDEADAKNMRVAVDATHLFPFPARHRPGSGIPLAEPLQIHLNERDYVSIQWLEAGGGFCVLFDAVTIHTSRREMVESGLFGHFGDAPVQVVAYNDRARLRKYVRLYEDCWLRGRDMATSHQLDDIGSVQYCENATVWKKWAEWNSLVLRWRRDRRLLGA